MKEYPPDYEKINLNEGRDFMNAQERLDKFRRSRSNLKHLADNRRHKLINF